MNRQDESRNSEAEKALAATDEQCAYCMEWYPKPVGHHHTEGECFRAWLERFRPSTLAELRRQFLEKAGRSESERINEITAGPALRGNAVLENTPHRQGAQPVAGASATGEGVPSSGEAGSIPAPAAIQHDDKPNGLNVAAQIAFDQQSDDPAPGDWNDACRHIAGLLQVAGRSATRQPCPYCTSDNPAIRGTYYDQTCEGCVKRMGQR